MNKNFFGRPSRSRLILAAGGCALLASLHAGAAPCTAGVCKATVTVQSCAKGTMSVNPDPIAVPAPNNIEWTLATEGYVFPANGIVIKGSGFSPQPGVTGSGKKFIVHDDHTDRRPDIKYVVRVTRQSDGAECAPFDPFINNH